MSKRFIIILLFFGLVGIALAQSPVKCETIVGKEGQGMWCIPFPAPTPTPTPVPTPCIPAKLNDLVVDKCAYPMTQIAPPTLGQFIIDPEFGTKIRRITDISPSLGPNAVARPMYSTVPAWNIDESKMIGYVRGKGHILFDGNTYQPLMQLAFGTITDIEQALWSNVDPDIIYYPDKYNGFPKLMKHNVKTNTSEVYQDFTGPCPVGSVSNLTLGSDPMYMTWPGRQVVDLACGALKFAFDLETKKVVAYMTISDGESTLAPAASPSGTYHVIHGNVYGPTFGFLGKMPLDRPYEHASQVQTLDGKEYWASVIFDYLDGENDQCCTGTLAITNLATRVKKIIIGLATGYPYPPGGTHISGMAMRKPGLVAVSVVGNPVGALLLHQELLLVDLNVDPAIVYRVAHHRSYASEGKWGYWGEPHVVASPTGTRLLFASDWGNGPAVNMYVVELPGWMSNN